MSSPDFYQGWVAGVGPNRVRAAVSLENYGFIVFDTGGPREVELGDLITGLARSNGRQDIRNQTQRRSMNVSVELFDATQENAQALLNFG
jgi:hypothetical protein